MMGTQAAPEQLFYDFCLEDHVPDDHLLRRIDRFIDLSDVRQKLKPFYCTIGRPSIDPELMIRMLIVGYCLAIRSERRLCEEVHLNLAYRWFCRLGLEVKSPITPHSRVTAMAASVRAMSCAMSSKLSCAGAWRKGLLFERALRLTRA
jgi:transposase